LIFFNLLCLTNTKKTKKKYFLIKHRNIIISNDIISKYYYHFHNTKLTREHCRHERGEHKEERAEEEKGHIAVRLSGVVAYLQVEEAHEEADDHVTNQSEDCEMLKTVPRRLFTLLGAASFRSVSEIWYIDCDLKIDTLSKSWALTLNCIRQSYLCCHH